MKSLPLQKITAKAALYDAQLQANDPRFNREVTIIHTDGTITHYNSAFLMKIKEESPTDSGRLKSPDVDPCFWIVCFTEHHDLHIEHSDELFLYWESERRHLPIEELK